MVHSVLDNQRDVASSKTPIERLPVDIVDSVLGHLGDKDFWRARRTHRAFRLDHSATIFKKRAIYWWLRVSPEEILRRRRGDIFVALYRRKRVPCNFNPWSLVMMAGDIALFDAVCTVIPFPALEYERRKEWAIKRGHLALLMHVRACYPHHSIDSDFICAVKHNQTAIALALAQLDPTRPQCLAEYAAHHGCIGCVSALFEEHGTAVSLGGVVTAAASGGQTKILDAVAPLVNEPAIWINALMVAAACNSVGSVHWITGTVRQPRDVLCRVVLVGSAHSSDAVVDALLEAHPDLVAQTTLTGIKCTFKDKCALLQAIPSKTRPGVVRRCWACVCPLKPDGLPL